MTLNRPEHNLLNEAMLREIADGITTAGERDDVKLIVLDSACKVFCGGIDIGEYTSQRVFQMLDAFHGAFSGMLEVGKPVVCVVNGRPSAAVLNWLHSAISSCHSQSALCPARISIGVFPPLASTILPFLVGPKIALELVLTGEPVTRSAPSISAWSIASSPKPSSNRDTHNGWLHIKASWRMADVTRFSTSSRRDPEGSSS